MANKQLKVDVIVNAKTKQLEKMFKKLNRIQTQINNQASAQKRVTRAVNETNKAYKKSISYVTVLTKLLRQLAGGYLMVQAAKTAITQSDNITKAENKLNNLNATRLGSAGYTTDASGNEVYSQATLNATQETMDKMYSSSQKVRMGYSDMMANVSKSMTLAGNAFGGNIDNAIRFQEVMAEAYALSGSSPKEMSSSMYQMIQGLGSGVLQGDELRSVREGASMAYKTIEEYAQGIYGAETNLKDLASQGKITSDIVVAAILQNGEKMDEAFAKTSMTFEQAWTMMKNTALKSFEPVLQKLNDLLNSDVGRAILEGINTAIQIVAGVLLFVFNLLEKIFLFIQSNWGVISKILLTAATILGGVLLYYLGLQIMTIGGVIANLIRMGKTAVSTAIKWVISWAAMSIPMLLIILIIVAIVIALVWLSDSFVDACGKIVGFIAGALSIVWNLFITLLTSLLKFILLPLFQAWDNFANFFGNLFNDPIAAIIHAFGGLADVVLSILQTIANGIDSIFGTELGVKVQGWRDNLTTKTDDLVNKYGNGTYEEKSDMANKIDELLSTVQSEALWNTSDAYNSGYKWGASAGNWLNDKAAGLKDKISGALNLGGLPNDSITPNLEDINGNTGKMADSMELAEEDLTYLRDVANMEWKKEFTTANITVDMTNNNTVSNDFDLNSLAIGLRNLVEEEMFAVADGVYV